MSISEGKNLIDWKDYLNNLLSGQTPLDGFSLCVGGERKPVSPIIKASILMLEDMIASQGNKNIFVFPDISQLFGEFLLSKVIYNIIAGKIEMKYDPHSFVPGQKLKYFNCILEFEKCEVDKKDKIERIYVKTKECSNGLPITSAPFFQIVDSNRRLSPDKAFSEARRQETELRSAVLDQLKKHKTHLDSSVVFVSGMKTTRDYLSSVSMDEKSISDILFLAQCNGDGEISNISSGQMSGNPAIIIAQDLYSAINAIEKGAKVQSVIVDLSQPNAIEKQLDAFNTIARYGFPVVCITDTANSFENRALIDRGYNEWRWDKTCITEALEYGNSATAGRRISNCARQTVHYIHAAGEEASEAMRLMYKHKADVEEQSSRLINTFEKLFSMVFIALRSVIPTGENNEAYFLNALSVCSADLDKEKKFISAELYDDLSMVILCLSEALSSSHINTKQEALTSLLKSRDLASVCLIISDRLDKEANRSFWETWCKEQGLATKIIVMYPQEYLGTDEKVSDTVVIVGWLSNKIMRNLFFRFDAAEYIVLTYKCEERWKRAHTKSWKASLDSSNNREVVKKSFSKDKREISIKEYEQEADTEPAAEASTDELDDIERIVQANRYRKYGSGNSSSNTIVDAYPVSFVGGLLAFYRSGHKVITATDIIRQTGDQIKSVLPEELTTGAFVVIRDTERDIIRDLADTLLAREGKSGLRALSSKWREALEVESLFSSGDEIYKKLCEVGCKKNPQTVKGWLTNDDLIIPQDQEDLLNIAAATNDDVLLEQIEEIYAAGREVRIAHTKAGRLLSERLRKNIAATLLKMDSLDPFNIWDPIELQIEDIGTVKILKVIDIGEPVSIEAGNTNRLISE